MEIAFEFVRTIIATVSRRCTNFVVDRASSYPKFRNHVINIGHATNTTYVYLKYIGRFWIVPPKSDSNATSKKEGEMKITANVKALTEEKALEVGADAISELMVLCILLSLVSLGIYIRRSKAAEIKQKQKQQEEELSHRLDEYEFRLQEIMEQLQRLNKYDIKN